MRGPWLRELKITLKGREKDKKKPPFGGFFYSRTDRYKSV